MSATVLKVVVAGHTNTGKTSLLRTLLWDIEFGEVSDRPAVTREVEGAALLVDGAPMMELYDTPGLEDSISLLDLLESEQAGSRADGVDRIQAFLASQPARGRFHQEAKVLRQVLASDLVLYVIDARDPVLGKHRDELTILGWCARPVVPVLNFVVSGAEGGTGGGGGTGGISGGGGTGGWREHLARLNLHAVVEFDAEVVGPEDERRLFEKMKSLLDGHREALDALIEDRGRRRGELVRVAAGMVAELVIEAAAYCQTVSAEDQREMEQSMEEMKRDIRKREEKCVGQLLDLFQFRADDCLASELPIAEGQWGLDLFSPAALREFGIKAGKYAATGAMIGLTLDIVSGGLSLGTGTAIGAGAGALFEAVRAHGKRTMDRMRGLTELRMEEAALRLLMNRQLWLVHALLRRGHATMKPLELKGRGLEGQMTSLPEPVLRARTQPEWWGGKADMAWEECRAALATEFADRIRGFADG